MARRGETPGEDTAVAYTGGHPSPARRAAAIAVLLGVVAVVVGADAVMAVKYRRYRAETERLRAGMTVAQRQRADLVVRSEEHRIRVQLELLRRQSRGDRVLHLAVQVDSGRMVLERDGVTLRSMAVLIGPERIDIGDSTIRVPPLGERAVARILGPADEWEVPVSVFQEQRIPVPPSRAVRGALGSHALVLNSGTVVYAAPAAGPLADSAYVLPGSVRVGAADLRAIGDVVTPGTPVYFYR